jgi:hypothetical protein
LITTNENEQDIKISGVLLRDDGGYDIIVNTPENPNGITLKLLSQGYNNVFGWVGGLVTRLYETLEKHNTRDWSKFFNSERLVQQQGRYPAATIQDLHAIVLIDEIDTYLHPEWQRTVLNVLVREFPNIQFIITTHSVDVLANIQTRKEKDYLVYRLYRTEEEIGCEEFDPKTYNMFGAEVGDMYEDLIKIPKRTSSIVRDKLIELQDFIKTKPFTREIANRADEIIVDLKDLINPNDAELNRLDAILETRKMLLEDDTHR